MESVEVAFLELGPNPGMVSTYHTWLRVGPSMRMWSVSRAVPTLAPLVKGFTFVEVHFKRFLAWNISIEQEVAFKFPLSGKSSSAWGFG